jgi:hypothetical protein
MSNRRPISLLSTFSKGFEILMHSRFLQNNVHVPEQIGFRKVISIGIAASELTGIYSY